MEERTYLEEKKPISLETIMLYQLDETLYSYEDKILTLLASKQFKRAETVLMDLCLHVLNIPEKNQLFVLRVFFKSIVTSLIILQSEKGRVPSFVLERSYHLIYQIENWKTNAEFMLHIESFIDQIKAGVIIDHLIYRGNEYVEKALSLIYHHLKSDYLTVNWLADELAISPTYLTSLFRKHLNVSASKYIAKKKIEAIIFELKHSNESLHTIRTRYGFSNHSHFIQFFKKHTGMTPLQYLQQHFI